ncbi:PREDICTED: rab-like protein 3 [Nicrophorus vespilloides]|uniref:Rab-like protein 3 n=1 Tax=Nicrophorus vespilloides TaxID=110193 RepID=A0ABM1NH44_NICVS|nr:PREDICTED: rab-like protein 3 [Nicrophorus vespilloides]
MSAIDRVRIMVLGDSGVGKTSFVHLAANNEPIRTPGWTVGCSVEVKLHEYKEGTPGQVSYFVEFWDVGGSNNHRNTRHVFYNPCHGVILVHDLTNKKSEENLKKWLHEIVNRDINSSLVSVQSFDDADPENFFGFTQIPILVIGTKLDQVDDKKMVSRSAKIANQLDADEILLDCRQTRYIAAGTSNAVKLSRFYDKVIDKRYYSCKSIPYLNRYSTTSPILPSKFYSPSHQD